jgi:type I restriction enzyme S subunit
MGQKISYPGDVVLTTKGTVGRVARISTNSPEFVYSPQVCFFRVQPASPLVDSYLYYWFKGEQFWSQARSLKGQTDMADYINLADIRSLQIEFPMKQRQRAIAAVLGVLDDKIAVNDRMAQTSLQLALARYQLSVRDRNLWYSISLAESARWLSGGTPKTSEPAYWDGETPWISALSLKSPWIDHSDRRVTELGASNGTRIVPRDTVIFVVRGSSLDSEFRIGLTQCEVAFGQDCKALLAKREIDPVILFVAIKSRSSEILQLVDHAGHGAGRLATDLLSRVELSVPAPHYSAEASAMLRPLVVIGGERQAENRVLARLRDTLLPGLMAGEIQVGDAEKAVEEAT